MLSASSAASNNGPYGNERAPTTGEPEIGVDPASGGFFHSDYKKHDDLKEMLDSSKDSLKLEAMKRIIGMVAKGRDASDLFPAVVKNVVSKNIEVKKLVYVYLVRYAEEQEDLALLSISTFQRALKEPNQLIRASALRVLSSIRVSMIVPIVMLAIREASADMSPYVRKTAAHAIPKLYSLDSEHKPELIEIIQKLLADKTVLVVGSAVMAFTEVCPERVDLIHRVYRKLCTVLVDVDEWGQVVIINMLTRYARTQFADPNIGEKNITDPPFYDSGSETSEIAAVVQALDPDQRLLIRSARPLLQSRNAAVVMAVAQLYYHCAPKTEAQAYSRALVRLLRSHSEVQCVVLDCIASISAQNREIFEPYLKSFFIRTSDPTRIKLLKLDILTNIVNEGNVSVILRELQTYISHNDKSFVAATIQAIGRCACSISDVTESCLNGLVSLLSNKDEAVVAESVVVIKRLLQTKAADPKDIIMHMTRLLDNITVAQARAAILWLLGENCLVVPRIAPDVLRKLAKTFPEEQDIVKLQVLNLAVKLSATNSEQTSKICQYVFYLARYDQNYDIRDRARLLNHFVKKSSGKIKTQTKTIFLSLKPAPLLISQFKDREQFQLGSLSHYINGRAIGYEPLPDFPENPPPGDVRDVEPIPALYETVPTKLAKKELFSLESDESSSSDSSESSSSEDEEEEDEDEENSTSGESDQEEDSKRFRCNTSLSFNNLIRSESSSTSSSSEENTPQENEKKPVKSNDRQLVQSNFDLLLDLNEVATAPVMIPSMGFLTPGHNSTSVTNNCIQSVPPNFIPTKGEELLNRINGRGLGITYRFTRNPHLFSSTMVNINLTFSNSTQDNITDIAIGEKVLATGSTVHDFASIPTLGSNCNLAGTLGVDFNDSIQPVVLEIVSSVGSSKVSLKPPIGELLKPITISEDFFLKEQTRLKGMNEHSIVIPFTDDIVGKLYRNFNVGSCQSSRSDTLRFAGQTLTYSSLVLITIITQNEQLVVTVNCEKMIIGSMVLNEIKTLLK